MEVDDISLMTLIKKGDAGAFELLLSRHQRSVYNLAVRFLGDRDEAEDVTQETFFRIFKAAPTYTPDAKFTTWLYTIVKNLCFNVLRGRKSGQLVPMESEYLPELPTGDEGPIERIARAQTRDAVIRAVARLPENMRMALILNKYHDLQYDEIARIMGCTVNAVKLRMYRARLILAKELAGLTGET